MAGFCESCACLVRAFIGLFRSFCTEFDSNIKELFRELAGCTCASKSSSERLQRRMSHELSLLQHDPETPVLNRQCLLALNRLAASEHHDLQRGAAMYYVYLSRYLESPIPVSFLEPFVSLLLSTDLEVQKSICLALVNLLAKNNLCEELVFEMGMLVPVLEMFQSGDLGAQCHSCACVATLTSSESNTEAIVTDGVIPLLVLAKSYDPQVQKNAAWALLNLTQSAWSMRVLCEVGALPVLILLLQSSDSEVQFYSFSALCNITAVPEHRHAVLCIGDNFLLKSLLTLMSSSVQKNSSQACRCLQILSTNVPIHGQLMELDCVLPLKAMLSSSNHACPEAGAALTSTLSARPSNHDVLVSEGLLDVIGRLLYRFRSCSRIISHSCTAVTNLCSSSLGQQAATESQCLPDLLQLLLSPVKSEGILLHVTSCLEHLMTLERLRSYLSTVITPEQICALVKLPGQAGNSQLSYSSAVVISKLEISGTVGQQLRPHYSAVTEYLLIFLQKQELKFQQLGMVTVCSFMRDGQFVTLVADSELEVQLVRMYEQTEETRQLLQMTRRLSSSSLEPTQD